MKEVRIQKYLSDCGVMSRRAAEKEILEGNVSINGRPAEIGQKILPGIDRVKYKKKEIKYQKGRERTYIMLYKPRGYVTTMDDELGRKCVKELVRDVGTRVYPIGRLDKTSEGLLLFTDDGDIANKLMHPKHRIPKIYQVRVRGEVSEEQLKTLNESMDIDGYMIEPVKTEIAVTREESTVLQMTLFEGKNRQIRKMCEKVGLEIVFLKRIAVGEIRLSGLRLGKWTYLTKNQINYLERMLNEDDAGVPHKG